jgi:mono/diheme cytochrome c family protein
MTRALPPVLLLILLAGCDGWPGSADPPPPAPPPDGAVARGDAARRTALAPPGPPVDAALLAEGADRYAIFCTPCHGPAGRGDGVVVARGHPAIPPLTGEVERTVAAITGNVAGAHPMQDRLAPRQIWAVARHVATLRGEP